MSKMKEKRTLYLFKWILVISLYSIVCGAISFGLILLTHHIISDKPEIDPIWIVGMIPLMLILTIPLALIIYHQVRSNIQVLVDGMDKVAKGNLDTYLMVSKSNKDFAQVFENFNQMVAQMESIENLRSQFFDTLSHELKTPIATINGFSQLLLNKDLSDEKRNLYLRKINEVADDLEDLIRNVLLLSKVDSTAIVTNKSTFSLSQQLKDCVISLEPIFQKKSLEIVGDIDDCTISSDQEMTKLIWINLLTNAIKFSFESGLIELSLRTNITDVIIAITDYGRGIPETDIPYLFEKHFQGVTASISTGNGLGLTIVKRIVKLLDGSIEVTSRVDEKTTFKITLPKN